LKILLIFITFIFISGCEYLDEIFDFNDKSTATNTNNNVEHLQKYSRSTLIIDNDSYDPDYIPLVLNSIYEHKINKVNIGLIITSETDTSNKTNLLYRSILDEFNSNIPLAISTNTNDRTFKSKLTNNIESYSALIYDDETDKAIIALENRLEAQDDKTVSYATGGKLIFLSKFLSDPSRLELFKLKVKEVLFALGCNPQDSSCSNDFNLAATNKAYNATKDVYSKLHGEIPFVVVNDKRGRVRSLDIFKDANIPLMHHLLGTNIYGTYGDHNAGDVEVLFAKSRADSFSKHKCNIVLSNRAFKATNLNGNGNDYLLINKSLDINGLTSQIYQNLIDM